MERIQARVVVKSNNERQINNQQYLISQDPGKAKGGGCPGVTHLTTLNARVTRRDEKNGKAARPGGMTGKQYLQSHWENGLLNAENDRCNWSTSNWRPHDVGRYESLDAIFQSVRARR
jgi:hypothetical protein